MVTRIRILGTRILGTRVVRRRRPSSLRLALTAAVVTTLVVGGAGASYALWSATAGVASSASTATVGVGHALSGSTLAHTYTSSAVAAVGVVTVTNTGTRAGTYSTSLTATSASTTLRSAVAVEIGTAASCTTAATLTSPATGTLNAAVTKTGSIAAGASVALCVRTTMTASGVSANPSTALDATIASSITIGTWAATAAPAITATQSVAAAAPAFTNSGIRYTIANLSQCVARQWGGGALLRGSGCGSDQLSEWRLVQAGNGTYYVTSSYNAADQPTLRWYAATTTSSVTSANQADVAGQQWTITQRADNLYRFLSAAINQCLVVGPGNVMSTAVCNDASAAQGFTITPIGTPVPPPTTLSCTGNSGNYIAFSWPALAGYQATVTYKLYINEVFVANFTNGYSPQAQLYNDRAPQVLIATHGTGSKTVEVKQSISGGEWTTTGTALMTIQPTSNNLVCG